MQPTYRFQVTVDLDLLAWLRNQAKREGVGYTTLARQLLVRAMIRDKEPQVSSAA